jgi:hypothetical protein
MKEKKEGMEYKKKNEKRKKRIRKKKTMGDE